MSLLQKLKRILCKQKLCVPTQKVWEGKIIYEEKRNRDPLEFHGEWVVKKCLLCGNEKARRVK